MNNNMEGQCIYAKPSKVFSAYRYKGLTRIPFTNTFQKYFWGQHLRPFGPGPSSYNNVESRWWLQPGQSQIMLPIM